MGIMKYIERKQAEKELGKGWFDNTKSNYNHYVDDVTRLLGYFYRTDTAKNKEYVAEILRKIKQSKIDALTAAFGKYLSLGLMAVSLSAMAESSHNALYVGAFGLTTLLSQGMQIKSNREARQLKDSFKEFFGLDDLSQSVYAKTTSIISGRRTLPFGAYVSDKTCHTCVDDACDEIIEHGFSK